MTTEGIQSAGGRRGVTSVDLVSEYGEDGEHKVYRRGDWAESIAMSGGEMQSSYWEFVADQLNAELI
ncbi:hypothetical protein [Mycolicibacterium sp.]|uniref:hypothetical protein n=1 Tax=Mycolicibacterium sp. TaxID=2320850 RepID=UPI0037C650E2